METLIARGEAEAGSVPPPQAERKAPTSRELRDYLLKDVPKFYRRLLADWFQRNRDERGRLRAGGSANDTLLEGALGRRPERAKADEEPELAEDRPLAAASARLAAAERSASPPRRVTLPPAYAALPTVAEARAMVSPPLADDGHDFEDAAHRSVCRACRRLFLAEP